MNAYAVEAMGSVGLRDWIDRIDGIVVGGEVGYRAGETVPVVDDAPRSCAAFSSTNSFWPAVSEPSALSFDAAAQRTLELHSRLAGAYLTAVTERRALVAAAVLHALSVVLTRILRFRCRAIDRRTMATDTRLIARVRIRARPAARASLRTTRRGHRFKEHVNAELAVEMFGFRKAR